MVLQSYNDLYKAGSATHNAFGGHPEGCNLTLQRDDQHNWSAARDMMMLKVSPSSTLVTSTVQLGTARYMSESLRPFSRSESRPAISSISNSRSFGKERDKEVESF
jgi:hypothetical protein